MLIKLYFKSELNLYENSPTIHFINKERERERWMFIIKYTKLLINYTFNWIFIYYIDLFSLSL